MRDVDLIKGSGIFAAVDELFAGTGGFGLGVSSSCTDGQDTQEIRNDQLIKKITARMLFCTLITTLLLS
jgi:hypothetical protein